MVKFATGFGTAPPATGGSETGPRGEEGFYRHFGTGTLPTGASGAFRRGEGGFWTVFGTGSRPTSNPEASSRGEGKGFVTVAGLMVKFATGFGTAPLATGCSEAGPRDKGGLLTGLRHGAEGKGRRSGTYGKGAASVKGCRRVSMEGRRQGAAGVKGCRRVSMDGRRQGLQASRAAGVFQKMEGVKCVRRGVKRCVRRG